MKPARKSSSNAMTATLTVGPVGPLLLRMSLSMLIGFIAGAAYNVTDTYFVSRLGTAELAAMGFTFPIVMTTFGLVVGIGVGTSSVLSRLIGQADETGTRLLTLHALLLGLVVTVVFITAGWLALPKTLALLGADSETLPLALGYLRIWLAGMVFLVIPIIGKNAIRATGDTLTPSLILVADMGLNIVLDPIFIFGFGPVPAMGIRGAALATVLARAAALVASLIVLRRAKHLLVFERFAWRALLRSWGRILYIGLPAATTNLLMPIAGGLLTRMISAYGVTRVAAFSAGIRIEHCVVIPLFALGASLIPFLGQNWGAGRYDRVRQGLRIAFAACLSWGAVCALALASFSGILAPLFSRDDSVVRMLILYLSIVPVALAFRGISHSICSSLNAMGHSLHSTAATALRLFGLQLPLALLGSHLAGFPGLLVGVVCGEVLAAGVIFAWLRRLLRPARDRPQAADTVPTVTEPQRVEEPCRV
ncbi:MAG: MATE family efflux transporter [Phycisphaerales bacterium]|nr:MAG: MATE family efflux transporter [Phycisphaerales bacterium]